MHVRTGELKDIQELIKMGRQLLELHVQLDGEYYLLEDNFDYLFRSWVRQQIELPSRFLLISEEYLITQSSTLKKTKLIGFISGYIKSLYPWFKTKTVGHISHMIVDPAYRRKGVGSLLEAAATAWFKTKKIDYVELYVEEKNIIGRKAWSAYGFQTFKKFLRKKI